MKNCSVVALHDYINIFAPRFARHTVKYMYLLIVWTKSFTRRNLVLNNIIYPYLQYMCGINIKIFYYHDKIALYIFVHFTFYHKKCVSPHFEIGSAATAMYHLSKDAGGKVNEIQ